MLGRRVLCGSVGRFGPVARHVVRPMVRFSSTLSLERYHELADHTMETLLEGYEALAEDIPEIDCDLSQGVFTLVMPPNGTYVINKQPPNKQIWLSSPLSGPKRYDWVDGKWTYSRDLSTLGEVLRAETKLLTDSNNCSPVDLTEIQ
jgi:frataxin